MSFYEGPRATRRPILRSGLTTAAPGIRKRKPSPTAICRHCGHMRKEHRRGKACSHTEFARYNFGVIPVSRCECQEFT